ncbi:MAG: peptidylprolyl isomerase [Gorillibacterium sp.]|nr:peptidylprolyl isomerase [Gorillibacterium sp.]
MRKVKLLWGIIVLLSAICMVLVRMTMVQTAVPEVRPEDNGGSSNIVVATVGNKKISLKMLEEQVYQKYGTEMLGRMLDHLSIQLEADERKLQVEDAEIAEELLRMQAGYESEEQFYQSMQEQVGMTRKELREDVYFKLLVEKAATSDIVVGDNEVSAYIDDNPDEFTQKREFHIQMILNESLEQANRTYELAFEGADFTTLAKERSLDTNTASEGGDLGWIEEHDPFLPINMLEKAKVMKPGDISKPIETSEGYVVIKLVDQVQEEPQDPEELQNNVRKQLALQKAPPIKDYIFSLRQKWKAMINVPSLKEGIAPPN